MDVNIIKVENEVTVIEPMETSLPFLARMPQFEGLYIVFKSIDDVKDTIVLLAYSYDSKKLREYMSNLHDESLFITNVPKQTGVYYLGGL